MTALVYPPTLPPPDSGSFTMDARPKTAVKIFASGRPRTQGRFTGEAYTVQLNFSFTLSEYQIFTVWYSTYVKQVSFDTDTWLAFTTPDGYTVDLIPTKPPMTNRLEAGWVVGLIGVARYLVNTSSAATEILAAMPILADNVKPYAEQLTNISKPIFGGGFSLLTQDLRSEKAESIPRYRGVGIDRALETTLVWDLTLGEANYFLQWFTTCLLGGSVAFIMDPTALVLGTLGDRNNGTLLALPIGPPSYASSEYFGKMSLPVVIWFRRPTIDFLTFDGGVDTYLSVAPFLDGGVTTPNYDIIYDGGIRL